MQYLRLSFALVCSLLLSGTVLYGQRPTPTAAPKDVSQPPAGSAPTPTPAASPRQPRMKKASLQAVADKAVEDAAVAARVADSFPVEAAAARMAASGFARSGLQ